MLLAVPEDIPPECPLIKNRILKTIGDKWTVLIIIALQKRTMRFNELKRAVGDISQQMLTLTLRQLERDGMVSRTVHPTVPPQVEYTLTPLGHSLYEPVNYLGRWAKTHMAEIESNRARYDGAAGVVAS